VKNRLHFTQIFEPQSWPDDFTIDIPFEHGDDIAAILPLGDTLLVFGQSKIFLISGRRRSTSKCARVARVSRGPRGTRGRRPRRRRDARRGRWDLPLRRRDGSLAVL
jgi:hypothetical protein